MPRKSKAGGKNDGILIVGMDKLLTQLGRCCKPAPPDLIQGYITRGKGISIHRTQCPNFAGMARLNPERVIAADWGDSAQAQESGGRLTPSTLPSNAQTAPDYCAILPRSCPARRSTSPRSKRYRARERPT